MADITYTVNEELPENLAGFEHYSEKDKALVTSFQVNNTFNPSKHYSELHILSLSDELIQSDYNYTGFKQLQNAQSAGQEGSSVLTIDPIEDSKTQGYIGGGVKLLYHFLNDLYTHDKSTAQFFIQDISPDRTELSLASKELSANELVALTDTVKNTIHNQSYFTGFRLNFKDNDLIIGTNIDTLDSPTGKVVVVKLYEPLPASYGVKNILNIVDIVADSVAYEVDSEQIIPPVVPPTLRSANFNIDIADNSVIPTKYFDYNDLFSYPVNNSNNQILSAITETGAEISINYDDYSNFIHFSSAQERLLNFKYKLDLISSYSGSLSSISSATTGLQGVSGSTTYYQNLITGIVGNFDHYERHLYYKSGSTSWPKSNTTKPYINKASTDAESITWYKNQISTAVGYDNTNNNSLVYSIPGFLREDANNTNYLTFVYMVGQHFDNLWLYSKAVTDKYDADNRINYGISKDLVGEALQNFGVKLYTSNKSIEDLFSTFIGQSYQSGSEKINNYITGSLTGSNTPIQPTSFDNYQKDVQKRIYHNLPLLLKSKGTERGLRALINCFGIQGDLLDIKYYGGRNNTERPFFGDYQFYTSSLDKIRLDNTGSIVSGSTLSSNTSIIKRDDKYTDDIHVLEVGFSHVDNIDTYIRANITGSFDIDDYIGDPQSQYENTYSGLSAVADTLLSGSLGTSGSYDLRDYVRLIKFYDNTIFKMVKDFIPARVSADTGIIIRPNLLNRSKAKSVTTSGSRPEYTGSIDTAFVAGGNAGIYNSSGSAEWSTAYTDIVQTPDGQAIQGYQHLQEQPKYNGELQGSELVVTNGNLTANNIYLINIEGAHPFNVYFVSSSNEICLLRSKNDITYITSSTDTFNLDNFFAFASYCNISESLTAFTAPYTPITFPRNFGSDGYNQYQQFSISATDPTKLVTCQASVNLVYGICNIQQNFSNPTVTQYLQGDPSTTYDLTTWFNTGPAATANLQYTASWNDGSDQVVGITNPTAYTFTQAQQTPVTITVVDTGLGDLCKSTISVVVLSTALGIVNTGSYENVYHGHHGLQFAYGSATPITNLQGVELNLFAEHLQYIGDTRTSTIHTNSTTINRGIPGYFTPYNYFAQYNLGLGPSTRYTAYTLTCLNANDRTYSTTTTVPPSTVGGWRGNWNVAVHLTADNLLVSGLEGTNTIDPILFQDKSAYIASHATEEGGDGLLQYLQNAEKTYPTPARYGPYRLFVPGQNNQAPFALTFQTQIYKTYEVDSNNYLVPLWRSKHMLDRAYIIRAYGAQHPESYAQVTVYGDSGTLNEAEQNSGLTQLPIEGAPYNTPPLNGVSSMGADDAKYIDLWLLVGWDYSTGCPTTYQNDGIYKAPTGGIGSYNNYNTPTGYGPWLKVPVRYFWKPEYPMSQKEQIMYVVGQGWGTPPGF